MKLLGRLGIILGTLVVAGAGLVYYLSGRVSVAADGNIIRNPGFEETENGLPAAWKVEKKAAEKGVVSIVASPLHAGTTSLSLQPNRTNSSASLLDNPLGVGQGFPAAPFRGKRLYVSAWMGAVGGATAVVGLFGLTKAGGLISAELKQPAGAPNLTFHEDVLVVPDDRRVAYVIVTCIAHGTSGAAYFDDVYVSTSVPASFGALRGDASESAQNHPREPLPAKIRINASKTLRTIPKGIYGNNLEWIWDGNGVWDSTQECSESPGCPVDAGVVTHASSLSWRHIFRFLPLAEWHWRAGLEEGKQSYSRRRISAQ